MLRNWGALLLSFVALRVLNLGNDFRGGCGNPLQAVQEGERLNSVASAVPNSQTPECRLASVGNFLANQRIWVRIWPRLLHKFDLVFLR